MGGEAKYRCGLLGLLNGYCGIFDDGPHKGCDPIAALVYDEAGVLVCFRRTDQEGSD
jgi:hypothetical protein